MGPKSKLSRQVILYLFPLLLLFQGCIEISAQKEAPSKPASVNAVVSKLSVQKMHDDLSVLWAAIKEMHPGYGIYTSENNLQKAYNKTYRSINSPLTESEFIDKVYPFLCNLKCGQTQLRLPVNYKPLPTEFKEPHLPFEVLVRNHRAWITTHQTEKLKTGDEVLSINGIPVSAIINHGYNLYCGDGNITSFKNVLLSEYNGFGDACYKYYHWMGPYTVKVLTEKGISKTMVLNPADDIDSTRSALKKADNYAHWAKAEHTGYLPLRFLNHSSTALFEVKTFGYADTVIYKEAFKQISEKRVKNLVIDLRHNGGGDIRVAINLLSYLADSSFSIVKDVKSRIPDPARNHFLKYFDTTRTDSFNSGFEGGDERDLWYHINVKPEFGRLYGPLATAKENRFKGNLYVLIDGATFSSAALFTAALKAQCKKAKLIGRETASAAEGFNGVTVQRLTLPNTKTVVEFPWMRVVAVTKNPLPGRGIIPDYTVNYSPEDVVENSDPDLEKVLSLLN
ncbi:MAG: hypothetical protein JWP44_1098 [Mucilaginibacter sp.]|nr:hypothetical protein [Mucilaginibacter sp.]